MMHSIVTKVSICMIFASCLIADEFPQSFSNEAEKIYVEPMDISIEKHGMWAKIKGEWLPIQAILRDELGVCVIIGAYSTTSWICGNCGWQNPSKIVNSYGPEYCENCKIQKPANKSPWNCKNCGKRNNSTSSRCATCSTLRPDNS